MQLSGRLWRWALAFALNALYFVIPLQVSLPQWLSLLHWGIGALIAVTLLGKLLYDTLFYDRYRP